MITEFTVSDVTVKIKKVRGDDSILIKLTDNLAIRLLKNEEHDFYKYIDFSGIDELSMTFDLLQDLLDAVTSEKTVTLFDAKINEFTVRDGVQSLCIDKPPVSESGKYYKYDFNGNGDTVITAADLKIFASMFPGLEGMYVYLENRPAPIPKPKLVRRKAAAPKFVDELKRIPIKKEPVKVKPVIAKPVITKPVITKPIVEEPVIEKPVMEEPAVEEPVKKKPVKKVTKARKSRVKEPEEKKPLSPIQIEKEKFESARLRERLGRF